MFLHKFTRPVYANAGACRFVLYEHQRNLGRQLMFPNLNNIDTSCNDHSS